MSQAEEWDWPSPREMRAERINQMRPKISDRRNRRAADIFFAAVVGLYRIALAVAMGGLVFGCLFLLVAILSA